MFNSEESKCLIDSLISRLRKFDTFNYMWDQYLYLYPSSGDWIKCINISDLDIDVPTWDDSCVIYDLNICDIKDDMYQKYIENWKECQ